MANNKLRYELELDSSGYRSGAEQASYTTKELKKSTEEFVKSFGPLKKQMREAKTEALNLASQFANLSRAEQQSEFGKALKDEMDLAVMKAAELQDVMADTQQAIKNAASDTQTWDALKEGMEIGKSAALAYASAIAQVTGNEEDLAKMVKTLTTIENTFNTAIKIGNAIQEQSALMTGIRRLQKWAAGVAEEMETKAKIKNTAATVVNTAAEKANAAATAKATTAVVAETTATEGATVAQRIFNAVAKANPYVLLATVAITAATAIGGYMLATSKSTKEEERAIKYKKQLHEASIEGAKDAVKETVKLDLLYKKITDTNKSMDERLKAVKKIKEEYPAYFGQLTDEEILVGNASAAYRQLKDDILQAAKARAYQSKIEKLAAEEVDLEDQIEQQKKVAEQARKTAEEMKKASMNSGTNGVAQVNIGDYGASRAASRAKDEEKKLKELEKQKEDNIAQQERYKEKIEETDKAVEHLNENETKKNKNKGGGHNTTVDKTKTELQKLQAEVTKWQTALENIDLSAPNADEVIKYVREQLKKAQDDVKNYKIKVGIEVEEPKDALEGWKKELKDLQLKINPVVDQKTLDEVWNKIHDLEDDEEEIQIQIDAELDPDKKQQLIDQLNEIKKQIEQQKLLLNTGIDPKSAKSLLDELDDLREEAKDLEELKMNPELDETKKAEINAKLQAIYDKISKLMSNIPVGLDEASLRQLIQRIEELEAQIEQREVEIGVKLEPKVDDKDVKKVQSIMEEVANGPKKDKKDYDFDFLPDESKSKKKGEKLLEEYDFLIDKRNELQKIMETSTDDQAIHDAQIGLEELNEKISDTEDQLDHLQDLNDKTKKLSEAFQFAGESVGAFADIFSKLGEATDNAGLKVMGIVAQAIATVALSFANALQSCKTWIEWLAFGATGLATMITMISQIKSITSGGYAQGGIIPGNSYSGDRLLANVNSGEMILNDRQQNRLLQLADGVITPASANDQIQVVGKIKGTDILLVSKNTNKLLSKSGTNINF